MAAATVDDADDIVVELGFVSKPGADTHTHTHIPITSDNVDDWDGGKLGGKPVWLHAGALPALEGLTCGRCDRPMPLLLQLFAPIDAEELGHDGAEVRMLYVFACVNEACVNRRSDAAALRPSVVCLRAQHSDALVPHSGAESESPGSIYSQSAQASCFVCGLPAANRCSTCRRVRYCSRAHQALHWRAGHKTECARGSGDAELSNSSLAAEAVVFPEAEIVVDEEPSSSERAAHTVATLGPAAAAAVEQARAGKDAAAAEVSVPDAHEVVEGASISDLTQKKLAEMTGREIHADGTMQYFLRRTACEPSQILRYCRWPERTDTVPPEVSDAAPSPAPATMESADGGVAESKSDSGNNEEAFVDDDENDIDADAEPVGVPLWTSSSNTPPCDSRRQPVIPTCERCGAARAFEFQILPQTISHVTPESSLKAWSATGDSSSAPRITIDFGTIIVYTCSKSCAAMAGSADAYAREYVWVQPMQQTGSALLAKAAQEAAAAQPDVGARPRGGSDSDDESED